MNGIHEIISLWNRLEDKLLRSPDISMKAYRDLAHAWRNVEHELVQTFYTETEKEENDNGYPL